MHFRVLLYLPRSVWCREEMNGNAKGIAINNVHLNLVLKTNIRLQIEGVLETLNSCCNGGQRILIILNCTYMYINYRMWQTSSLILNAN